jgi:peptidoglycan/LPS O-acetylase OafA/YrhL
MRTIGSVLEANRGIGKGFDFVRIFLATLIVLNHSFLIVDGDYNTITTYKLWPIFSSIVPMFFALSGFLITGSAQRLNLTNFLINRGIRIVPALAVDILVATLLIGTLLTTEPLPAYLADKKFRHYFLNIVGFIHYELPGVFASNPDKATVNGSLWTIPFEIGCYALMSMAVILGCIKTRRRMLIGFLAFLVVFYSLHLLVPDLTPDSPINNYVNGFITARGGSGNLYFYFLAGSFLYVFKDSIPVSLPLAVLAGLIIQFNGLLPLESARVLVLAFPIAYLTAYIGLLPIPKLPLYSKGDYSYGVYLYAYPLQQTLVALFPGKFTILSHFVCSMAVATGVAMISWHFVEKPILGLRKKFSFAARLHP